MAEMLQNEVRESVLTEKDIKKAYTRWYNCCEISNSYERMQTVSFCYAISSVLKKLYPKKEEYVAALQRHLNFFNSQGDRKSTRLNSSHMSESRMPSSA